MPDETAINTSKSIYFCNRANTHCCIVGSHWDDGAALIACKYEDGDITDHLFTTEKSCLTMTGVNYEKKAKES